MSHPEEIEDQTIGETLIDDTEAFLSTFKDLEFRYNTHLAAVAAEVQCLPGERKISKSNMVDLGYLLRQISKTSKEMRKQSDAHCDAFSVLLCKKIVEHICQYPSAPERAEGTIASCTPNIKPMPRNPKIGTPEWEIACDHFGIPEQARETVAFDFKRLGTYLLQRAHAGKNVPVDLTQPVGTEFDVIYRSRKRKTKR